MRHLSILSLAAALTLSISGCSGFLDEDMKSSLTPGNTYTSTYGFETAATGLYSWARAEFSTWNSEDDAAFTHSQACPYEALQVATDIVFTAHKDGSLVPFENLTYTASSVYVESYWNWAYGLIANCNALLTHSEDEVDWDNASDKSLYQATARFFRAYAYRYLVYLYGDVPFVDKVETEFRIDFTRTPKAEVLQKMIEDLQFAAANLPENPDSVEDGKLTKWAALHLLSEVYLMAGMNQEAADAAQEVINAGYFHLMTERFGNSADQPGDVFSDLFKEYNQNRKAGNQETVWAMQFEYNTTGGGGVYDDWTKRAWNAKYYNVDGFVLCDSLGGRGLAQIVPFPWWVDSESFYDATDIRNSDYNIKRNWYYNNPESEKYGKKAEITQETWEIGNLLPTITKFWYGKTADNEAYEGNNKDRMKFRLAETYLLLAEANINLGNTQAAAEAINTVRRRAGASDITPAQATIDFLLDERIRELVGEELRRFTLVRTGKMVERTKKYNTVMGSKMVDTYTLWPIPQSIIDSNTGAEFPQNPGY